QSQTITVDRQMRRYNVPRIVFVNKCDRQGAAPARVVPNLRSKLKVNAWPVQVAIGLEGEHKGVVDLVRMEAVYFEGARGETVVREKGIPARVADEVAAARAELIAAVADVDDEFGELVVMEGD